MDRIDEILNDEYGKWVFEKGIGAIYPPNFPKAYEDAAKKAMEQYAKEFSEWLSLNTTIVYANDIILYKYCDRYNEWGNYTLDYIYTVFTEEINK